VVKLSNGTLLEMLGILAETADSENDYVLELDQFLLNDIAGSATLSPEKLNDQTDFKITLVAKKGDSDVSGQTSTIASVNLLTYGGAANDANDGSLFVINGGISLEVGDGVSLHGINNGTAATGQKEPLVSVGAAGTFIMSEGSTITLVKNIASADVPNVNIGGAVRVNSGGEFIMEGGTITGVEVKAGQNGSGAGVYVKGESARFTMKDGKITANKELTSYGRGAGVYINGTGAGEGKECLFTMTGGEITENEGGDSCDGLGVYIRGASVDSRTVFSMSGGLIARQVSTTSLGGGVYVDRYSKFELSGTGQIASNQNGGVFIECYSIFEMTGGEISNNTSIGFGGGVLLSSAEKAEFTMTGGEITGNTAVYTSQSRGGGVYIGIKSVFNMKAAPEGGTDPVISGNTAELGGGVYVAALGTSYGTFNMEGGIIKKNQAVEKQGSSNSARGGGVYVAGETTPSGLCGLVNKTGGVIAGSSSGSDANTVSNTNGNTKAGQAAFLALLNSDIASGNYYVNDTSAADDVNFNVNGYNSRGSDWKNCGGS
jgi:hypothetical protein